MKVIISLLIFCVMLISSSTSVYAGDVYESEVIEVYEEGYFSVGGVNQPYQILRLEVIKGDLTGKQIRIDTRNVPTSNNQLLKVGDKVIVSKFENISGGDEFIVTDYVRRESLIYLFAIFSFLAILVGGKWGITSLFGMGFSFLVIFKFILPQIILGRDAILTAIVGSIIIIPVTFSLSHGLNKKTLVSILGTVTTLIITGLIARVFVDFTRLTGFASEEANFLQYELSSIIDMKGILLAGIIISSLGVLDDITISQASIVKELKSANAKLSFRELMARSMNVGKDHIASLINTLVLVYAGASLPLFLLFINSSKKFSDVINYEIVADEIVRTLVGSIGLILAVPITTVMASYVFSKKVR